MAAKKKNNTENNINNFYNNEYYMNRELSWLQFNSRCLSEAKDKATPLFEKLKFLSITSSNLDEFFMVRVASLKDMINAGYKKPDIAGMSPKQQLDEVTDAVHDFVVEQYRIYNRLLLPELEANGIELVKDYNKLSAEEADYIDR